MKEQAKSLITWNSLVLQSSNDPPKDANSCRMANSVEPD